MDSICWPDDPKRESNLYKSETKCQHIGIPILLYMYILDPVVQSLISANPGLKGYSSDQSHFLEINIKLAKKNKYATHSVQKSLEMCENK